MKRTFFLISTLALLASLLGTTAVVHQHTTQTFGTVNGLPDPSLDPRPSGLAVNVALQQYGDLNPVLDSLTAFYWLRQTFPWDEIEPRRGEFYWDTWDQIVGRVESRRKELIAVLNYTPAWALPAPYPPEESFRRSAPPASVEDFARFAGAFAARYRDQIDVYQIWDEPNILLGWGGQPPSAARYAALLQAAYAAIHAADSQAIVLAAALAPNVETGPDNYSDLIYLQQLYDFGAGKYFDAAAGKPYGYYTGPDHRAADPAILNFSRFTLLRQVMEDNGDAHKLLWAGNFGWNTHEASAWGRATSEAQAEYTLAAYRRARNEWPWAGPLALENFQPAAPPDDPHWGFALVDVHNQPAPLLTAINAGNSDSGLAAPPGNHFAVTPSAQYYGDWKFSDLGADIPQTFETARLEFTFQGTDLALKVRRADYRAYLYVTIDGQPANRLPRDERGAYLVLTSPDLRPQVNTVPVASGLDPNQVHIAVIQPDRGWEQWAVAGFSVGHRLPITGYLVALTLVLIFILLSLGGMWHFGRQLEWGAFNSLIHGEWERLGATGQLFLTAIIGALLYLSSWLTFGDDLIAIARRFGDTVPIVVTALTAGVFYFSPSFLFALLSLIALFLLFYLRLDLALAFAALFIPFYLQPRPLWQRGASLVEITTLMALVVWSLHNFRPILTMLTAQGARRKAQGPLPRPRASDPQSPASSRQPPISDFEQPLSSSIPHPSSFSTLDWAFLALLVASALSIPTASLPAIALREYRVVILEPVIFYFILRYTPLDRKELWRIVDFFVLGAVVVAGIGLYQYVTQTNLITAEGGVERIRSVYGSPNNLALYLGRAFPITLAVALMSKTVSDLESRITIYQLLSRRRFFYALAAVILGLTLFLTYSKGALFLGIPAAVAFIFVGWLRRRGLIVVGAGAAASLAALPFLSRIPRFAALLNPASGTSFFRTKLWLSAWRMFLDQPLFGVGPDNFLYQYRSKYILPEAWQEPNLSHPHNIALDYLSRLGLFGFASGLWLQIGFWKAAVGVYRRLRSSPTNSALLPLCLGLMASVADMLAHGLVDNSFFLVDLAYAFCLTLALMQHLQRLARESGP